MRYLMEVSTVFYICRYCVFTWYDTILIHSMTKLHAKMTKMGILVWKVLSLLDSLNHWATLAYTLSRYRSRIRCPGSYGVSFRTFLIITCKFNSWFNHHSMNKKIVHCGNTIIYTNTNTNVMIWDEI